MTEPVAITGMAVTSAYGRGCAALLAGVLSGRPAFGPVTRFDVSSRRVGVAATLGESPSLRDELVSVIGQACSAAGVRAAPLFLAAHSRVQDLNHFGEMAVMDAHDPSHFPENAQILSRGAAGARLGGARLGGARFLPARATYTSACVAASTAVADAASAIAHGDAQRVVVAAGYLVEPDQFALFDAGRALAVDGAVRPFSKGRKGLLLGDGVAAIVLDAKPREPLAWIKGWGRAGDAYHVCQPRPDGSGLARAISSALKKAGIAPSDVDYVNAHGSGSPQSDAAEANALDLAGLAQTPVSSTKSLHGQALEASPLLELITTVLAMNAGSLPANAGYLGPDPECAVNVILDKPLIAAARNALVANSAFGGANTALVIGAP